MKGPRSLLLLVLVLGLGAYIYWVDSEKASTPEREAAQRRAFSIDLDRLSAVRIRRSEYAIGLRLEGDEWYLSSPEGVPASQATVRQTLSRLRGLSRGELITPGDMRERGQTLADFGLAVPLAVLTLEDSRGTREYRIGNPNPLGNALYVKEENSQNVMLISSDLMEILPVRADAFRDRRILPQGVNAVRALSFLTPGRLVRLEAPVEVRGEVGGGEWAETWVLSEPFRFPAETERVLTILEQLNAARIERFLLPGEISGEPFGRDEDLVVLRVYFSGTLPSMELVIGNRVPGEPQSRYARFAGQDGVFVVSEGLWSMAHTELLALQTLNILPVRPEQIKIVSLEGAEGNDSVELVRNSEGWFLRSPVNAPASTAYVQRILEAWTSAIIEERHDPEHARDFLYRFQVELADGSSPYVPTSFDVYTDVRNPVAVWVSPRGMAERWRIFPDTLRHVPVDPLAYLTRTVLRFSPAEVIRVQLQGPEREVTFTRPDAQAPWRAQVPGKGVNTAAIAELLEVFGALDAEKMLARGSVDLTDWGLETAPYRISFGLGGDKPGSRTLRIAPHPEWGAVASVQGQDLIFALPESVFQLLEAKGLFTANSEVDSDDSLIPKL